MKGKSCIITVFFMMCIISACGKTEINYSEMTGMSEKEKEQKYIEYLTDEIRETLTGYDDIKNIDIEIAGDTGIWNVNVKIDYSDSMVDVTEVNQHIEEVLANFLPEGTNLSVTTGHNSDRGMQ